MTTDSGKKCLDTQSLRPIWSAAIEKNAQEACKAGKLDKLRALLPTPTTTGEYSSDGIVQQPDERAICDLLATAVGAGQVEAFEFLAQQRFPGFPSSDPWLGSIQRRITATVPSLSIYKAVIKKWPQLRDWDLGETGNYLGTAAMNNDTEFVEYLIEHEGADANEAKWLISHPLRIMRYEARYKHMIALLERYMDPLLVEQILNEPAFKPLRTHRRYIWGSAPARSGNAAAGAADSSSLEMVSRFWHYVQQRSAAAASALHLRRSRRPGSSGDGVALVKESKRPTTTYQADTIDSQSRPPRNEYEKLLEK